MAIVFPLAGVSLLVVLVADWLLQTLRPVRI
jgi:uncharacterized iron-regulated membrane protein